jgi:hypothetical protein
VMRSSCVFIIGRGKGSGAPVEARFWQVWIMRDGKAVRVTHHIEKADALEAAALRVRTPAAGTAGTMFWEGNC